MRKIKIERKSWKILKMVNMSKVKWGCLGRYMNRQEAGKNVLRSWDRDLSIGEVQWSITRKSKWCKNQKWKRKWSFGTLWKSQLSRKKCSEQLRSRKIYWWAQKFLRGHKNRKKGHHDFGFWDRADVIFPTHKIFMIWCSKWSQNFKFRPPNSIFVKNLIKIDVSIIFSIFVFFRFFPFWHFSNFWSN